MITEPRGNPAVITIHLEKRPAHWSYLPRIWARATNADGNPVGCKERIIDVRPPDSDKTDRDTAVAWVMADPGRIAEWLGVNGLVTIQDVHWKDLTDAGDTP